MFEQVPGNCRYFSHPKDAADHCINKFFYDWALGEIGKWISGYEDDNTELSKPTFSIKQVNGTEQETFLSNLNPEKDYYCKYTITLDGKPVLKIGHVPGTNTAFVKDLNLEKEHGTSIGIYRILEYDK